MAKSQRETIVGMLSSAGAPMTAGEVAELLGLHVTTARFHLAKLVDDGRLQTTTMRNAGVGRPRIGYQVVPTTPTDSLVGHLMAQLGTTVDERENAGVEAGRLWAQEKTRTAADVDLPDPVTVAVGALQQLGFEVSDAVSAFGTHELRMCACPLRDIARRHPEVARGVARGVLEQALASSSPALGSQYGVVVSPDPSGGGCEIVLRLAPLPRAQPDHQNSR